jgi:hypothetical protein
MKQIILPKNNFNFTARVNIADQTYTFHFKWNNYAERWSMTVTNASDEVLFHNIFVAVGVRYAQIFTGFPEHSEFIFTGNEKDSTFENLTMVVSDDLRTELEV